METMTISAVYDNGGKTVDRYTVVFNDGSCLGLSSNPTHPQGFSQWGQGVVEGPHLGTKIRLAELPKHVQKHIAERMTNHNQREVVLCQKSRRTEK